MKIEIHYCDRCKKELDTIIICRKIKIYKKRYTLEFRNKEWNETQKELCEDCYKGFLNWMGEQ